MGSFYGATKARCKNDEVNNSPMTTRVERDPLKLMKWLNFLLTRNRLRNGHRETTSSIFLFNIVYWSGLKIIFILARTQRIYLVVRLGSICLNVCFRNEWDLFVSRYKSLDFVRLL